MPLYLLAQVADTTSLEWKVDGLLGAAQNNRMAGKNTEALYLAQQAADISKNAWGKYNLRYATALHRLASIYCLDISNVDTAEAICREALSIRDQVLGVNNPDYAHTLTVLGFIKTQKRAYQEAEKNYLQALNILGDTSKFYISVAFNLGQLYTRMQLYEKAIKIYERCKKLLPKNEISYAINLMGLGGMYADMGDLGNAQIQHEEARDFFINGSDPSMKKSIYYAEALKGLGNISTNLGDYKNAIKYFQEAVALIEEIDGTKSSNLMYVFNDLGLASKAMQDFAQANSFFEKALSLIVNKESVEYATILTNQGNLLFDEKKFDQAKFLYVKAKDIKAKIIGLDNRDYANSLLSIGNVYYEKGIFDTARIYYKKADTIFQKVTGKNHSDYANITYNIALSHRSQNTLDLATNDFVASNTARRDLIMDAARYFTEKELIPYLNLNEKFFDQFYSFVQAAPKPDLVSDAYDNTLILKGFLLENARLIIRSLKKTEGMSDIYERLQGCRRRLAQEYSSPDDILKLEAEAEGYEKMLARNLSSFRGSYQVPRWQEVRDMLCPNEAALEFIQYRYYSPKTTDSIMYVALVLLPSDTCPHFIPLCEKKSLDSLLKQNIPSKKYGDALNGQSLYSLIWQPIEFLLKETKTVHYAPVGVLHSINLDAIKSTSGDSSTLIDRYNLVRLGSTRQLATPVPAKIIRNDALLIGGITYDSDITEVFTFDSLPGTLEEVDSIRQLLEQKEYNVVTLTGLNASEEKFMYFADSTPVSNGSPRILHIATHGYFFPDTDNSKTPPKNEPRFKASEHPFLRSGLILADGNHTWRGKPLEGTPEDGILTSYEISAISLPNTELVVLSACKTALGDLAGNEGIYGLQRAFKIAGVRYLIMSLVDVNDEITKDLMQTFYINWLDIQMDIPSAFREAQLYIKKKYKDPEVWAAFVLLQ